MERVQTKLRRGEGGFTLVELAIVMIIIGLLITGVLKGQEMIANAQVTSTVAQVKGVDAATTTFRDTYAGLPGDLLNPAGRLAGCNAVPCNVAGDGDGRINASAAGGGVTDPGLGIAAGFETLGYWSHLAAADLISGVNTAPQTAPIDAGDEVLAGNISNTSFRMGFMGGALPTGATAAFSGALATWRSGHYLALGGNPTLNIGAGGPGNEGLSPLQASRIDIKIDDGNPLSGQVRGAGAGNCVVGGIYDTANTAQADCDVFIRIQG